MFCVLNFRQGTKIVSIQETVTNIMIDISNLLRMVKNQLSLTTVIIGNLSLRNARASRVSCLAAELCTHFQMYALEKPLRKYITSLQDKWYKR